MFACNKQDLSEHSVAVSLVAVEIANFLGVPEAYVECARVAGLLHDIGLAAPRNQKSITENKEEDSDYPGHHEISWAFLSRKLSSDDGWEISPGIFLGYDKLLRAIYWHHPQSLSKDNEIRDTSDEILHNLRLSSVEDFYNSLKLNLIERKINKNIEIPMLYVTDTGDGDRNDNAESLVILSCLTSADSYISKLDSETVHRIAKKEISSISILHKLTKGGIGSYKYNSKYCPERFKLQEEIADQAAEHKTFIVQAPGGFGKTALGVLWGSKIKTKVITPWVCPRNSVAIGVYDTLIKEVAALGLDCTVELYLTGERKQFNREDKKREPFSSDIVVTNIDNFLSPMVSSDVSDRMFLLLGSNAVFDEFNEITNYDDGALFSAFITIMRARARICSNPKTMCSSATPTNIYKLWDNSHRTVLLPSGERHYPAQHKKKYKTIFIENLKSLPRASIAICNAVRGIQNEFVRHKADHIVHSRYTESDKELRLRRIINRFGKGGLARKEGDNAVGGPLIQSALDISADKLSDIICSPESTLQRLTRCNRWGETAEAEIFYPLELDGSESAAIKNVYSIKLRNLWLDFYKRACDAKGGILTLDEAYAIYNGFYEKWGSEVLSFFKERYIEGTKELARYRAFKAHKSVDRAQDRSQINARTLRNPRGGFFFTLKTSEGKWLPPDQVMREGNELRHRCDNNKFSLNSFITNGSKMEKTIKEMYNAGYESFERILKNKKRRIPNSIKSWFGNSQSAGLARNPATPFPDISRVYDSELGIVER